MAINLLPPKYQPKPLLEWRRLTKLLIISSIALLVGFLGVNYYLFRTNLSEREANLQVNIASLQPAFNKIKEYENTLEKAKKIEELTNKIGKAREVWSDILADLAGSLTEDIWFVQITKEEDKVLIEGEAHNFAAVGNLAVNIRKLPWFKQVDIKEAKKIENDLPNRAGENLIITDNVKFKITAEMIENIRLFVAPEKEGTD